MNESVSFEPIHQRRDSTGGEAEPGSDMRRRNRAKLEKIQAPKVIACDAQRFGRTMVQGVDRGVQSATSSNDIDLLNAGAGFDRRSGRTR